MKQTFFTIKMSLNPLANPKGIKLNCELCQKPAFVQCTRCRVTYYCSVEHQKIDWIGIHEKICQLLIPLKSTSLPFLSSEEERVNRKQLKLSRQKNMIDLTRTTGLKLLFDGKHEEAIPAALQALRFSIDVYGLDSIELVPAYLILGEASIGLGHLGQAEEYLSQAQWTVLKTPECSNTFKSRLYRNLGLLHASQGNYEEALRQLADDIYHAAEEWGTDDIRTSGGYYHMGNVFLKEGAFDIADSMFEQVTDIWHSYLQRIVTVKMSTSPTPKGIGPAAVIDSEPSASDMLDEAQEAEARQVLTTIFTIREEESAKPEIMVKLCHALAMLYFINQDNTKSLEFAHKAEWYCQTEETNEQLTDYGQSVRDFIHSVEPTLSVN